MAAAVEFLCLVLHTKANHTTGNTLVTDVKIVFDASIICLTPNESVCRHVNLLLSTIIMESAAAKAFNSASKATKATEDAAMYATSTDKRISQRI